MDVQIKKKEKNVNLKKELEKLMTEEFFSRHGRKPTKEEFEAMKVSSGMKAGTAVKDIEGIKDVRMAGCMINYPPPEQR